MGGRGQFLDFMGGHSCYEGGHRAHGGSPKSPPGKTLISMEWKSVNVGMTVSFLN